MLISAEDRRARARAELRRGAPIVLLSTDDAAALVAAAETLNPQMLNAVRDIEAREGGQLTLAISRRRAEAIKARAYDGDLARLALSARYGAADIAAITDPAKALDRPLIGPHETVRDSDNPSLHRKALLMCVEAMLLPAALVLPLSKSAAAALTASENLVALTLDTAPEEPARWIEASHARVPIAGAHDAQLRVFRRIGWDAEHYAYEINAPDRRTPVLTRLHSACVTGDILGSLKCDCGPQLRAALSQMIAAGGGLLLYLLQEGRGIGLANKMRAYQMQDQGYDTVEANHLLGFEDDERRLADGAALLKALGVTTVNLMTNNPAKVAALEASGVHVAERIPLIMPATRESEAYLSVKAKKSGHIL